MLRLQEFDLTILYKSGRMHADADALSRCSLPVSEDPKSLQESVLVLVSFDATIFLLEEVKDPGHRH